ncbi:MAG: hypothetical protein E7612_11380 [Ruminococcaceae bacterium]|nr:hypothetical protein [Oscillospiraceae bacterium]
MKKVISLLICGILLAGMLPIASFAAIKEEVTVMPMYNNTTNVTSRFVIEEGVAKLTVAYVGKFNTLTRGVITSKIQVQTSNGWVDVNNGELNNEWVDESTNITFSITHTQEVPRGTYRALITFEMYGTGGSADIIERTYEYTY